MAFNDSNFEVFTTLGHSASAERSEERSDERTLTGMNVLNGFLAI